MPLLKKPGHFEMPVVISARVSSSSQEGRYSKRYLYFLDPPLTIMYILSLLPNVEKREMAIYEKK